MLSTITTSTSTASISGSVSIIARSITRSFTTSIVRSFEDSPRNSAIALDPTPLNMKKQSVGNSFNSFAEYRKSAIQHGPLRGKEYIYHTHGTTGPILIDEKDYGVSERFARIAREQAYREHK